MQLGQLILGGSMRKFFVLFTLIVLVAACRPQSKYDMKPGIGTGPGGMSDLHHAQVPKVYAGMRSPDINEYMLAIGAAVYETHSSNCHGIEGLGNGPAGSALVPAPAPVGHTSQMLSDAYLFWRMNDGGSDFNSAMPAWKDVLSEDEIWSVIAYTRALGHGEASRIQDLQYEQM